ncbi:hypothetical protein ARMSODRAFT_974408 [Armillaria solidipes]|uniref:Uncharacterized protein n=1 Tax=Armillaria solidipes TaxID=1076256 RepID=A0A2H3BWN9_9AGAR|nr:hypothetical protein ARMSODRAFT_974408 [Armillaria solidipes]
MWFRVSPQGVGAAKVVDSSFQHSALEDIYPSAPSPQINIAAKFHENGAILLPCFGLGPDWMSLSRKLTVGGGRHGRGYGDMVAHNGPLALIFGQEIPMRSPSAPFCCSGGADESGKEKSNDTHGTTRRRHGHDRRPATTYTDNGKIYSST